MLRDVWMIQDETLSGGDGETMRDSRVEVGKEEEKRRVLLGHGICSAMGAGE